MTFIPIGRFAAATRLLIKALRLYDQCELLPAAFVDPQSGYRYYRPEQLRLAATIRTLRAIDGGYTTMGATYATIGLWIQEHGHTIIGPSREIYLTNPNDVAEAELRTEIQWPIDDDNGR